MPGLTISWQYLTGYCRATDPSSRKRVEWPPHPGRVFMALAAAWFETGEDADEGMALRWLEKLPEPELILPAVDPSHQREVVTAFVPVNDTAGPSAALLQSAPQITRARQPRTFPAIWVGDTLCCLHWSSATPAEVHTHRAALERLCANVTRIGHSSSLVHMQLEVDVPRADSSMRWIADEERSEKQLRRVSEGTLALLDHQFNRKGREQYEQLSNRIEQLKAEKPRGAGARERKASLQSELEDLTGRRQAIDAREPVRPKLGLWTGYRPAREEKTVAAARSAFDSDLLVLVRQEGPALPSVSTLALAQALRGLVMKDGKKPLPGWVSGHLDSGEVVRDGRQHLACLALPHCGHPHADGHLLGVALAFPAWVERRERGQVLGPILTDPSGEPKECELQLGRLGVWRVSKRVWSETRKGLKQETWTAHPHGARTWASVTPVVLDGFPKQDRQHDRAAWSAEVVGLLARACLRVGLPEPAAIEFDTTSWHEGSPRASQKRRPLRGHPGLENGSTALGDGFPFYPVKTMTGTRPQVHVWLRFAEPVVGPILLGAGRFLGYGLCKPLEGRP